MKDTKKLRFSAYLADVCTSDYFTGVSSLDKQREVLAVPVSPRMRHGELLNSAIKEIDSLFDWFEDFADPTSDFVLVDSEIEEALRQCFKGIDLRTTFEPSEDLEDGDDMETLYAYFVITFEG